MGSFHRLPSPDGAKKTPGILFQPGLKGDKKETLRMWADGCVAFKNIDRGWMIWTGTSQGPVGIMDAVGLDVVYGIETAYYEESQGHSPGGPQNQDR